MLQKKQTWRESFKGSGLALIVYYISELIEEGIENLIALSFSVLFSGILIVAFTVLAKVGIKFFVKLILPFVKALTYKEGKDKMKWLKNAIAWIRYNVKSLVGTLSALVAGVSVTIGANAEVFFALPQLVIFGLNFTPIIAGLLVFAGVELAVVCKGFETIATAKKRIAEQTAKKEEKALVKEAKKEIKAEVKLANQTQTQKEKEDAKKLAKEKAEQEKAQKEQEHRAKLDKVKAEIRAENEPKS